MYIIRAVMFFTGAVLLLLSCKAQKKQAAIAVNSDDNSLLWEVSGNGLKQSSYIFGTFHLMCRSDIKFSANLKTAVANSDIMYLEMDMDDPAMMLGGLMMMNMKGGKKLKDLYTEAEYEKLESFFRDTLHTPLTFFGSAKPFFLTAMLYPKLMPCKNVAGVEDELMKLAKLGKKEIKGLETMEFQSSVFDSIPYEEQAKELLNSIDSMATYSQYFDTMINVYKSQQLTRMEALFNKSEFGMQAHEDLLLNNRNRNWTTQLKDIMKKQSAFVAVGAGHLPGEQGLLALLKKAGYTVRPLENK